MSSNRPILPKKTPLEQHRIDTLYDDIANNRKTDLGKHKRKDVYYILSSNRAVGEEMPKGRPAVIVSNDNINSENAVYEIVFLTSKQQTECTEHVAIYTSELDVSPSYALCEQITSVSIERFGKYITTISDEQMRLIELGMLKSLGLNENVKEDVVNKPSLNQTEPKESTEELYATIDSLKIQLGTKEKELTVQKRLYNDLVKLVVSRKKEGA